MAEDQDDTEMLIEAVRSFPCLWNMSLREYKDNRVKENAWKKMSEKLATSVDDSKRRWKNLRDMFVRERKISKPRGQLGRLVHLQFLSGNITSCVLFKTQFAIKSMFLWCKESDIII